MYNRINASFPERIVSALDTVNPSPKAWLNFLRGNWQLFGNARWQVSGNARGDHGGLQVVKRVVAEIQSLIHSVVFYLCIMSVLSFVVYGLFITAWISVRGLMERHHYGDKDGRTNMDPAHDLLYAVCIVQFALFMYRIAVVSSTTSRVKQVSQAYGLEDGGLAVQGYLNELVRGCMKNPSSAKGRNVITYAVDLIESNKPLSDSCLSGALILDRLTTREHTDKIIRAPGLIEQEEQMQQQQQLDLEDKAGAPLVKRDTKKKEDNKEGSNKKRGERKKKCEERKKKWEEWMEERRKMWEERKEESKKKREERKKKRHRHQQAEEEIIVQQRRVIKRLIGSASSTHILEKLLQTLDSRRSSDRKMREAAARILEHVADGVRLEQFPQGIQCISSLINTFEEYRRLQPYQSSSSSSNKKEATTMSLPPPPNTKNGQEQEQGSRSINTSSLELNPDYSESESEPEPDSESEVDRPSLSTRLCIRWRRVISKGSSTATTTSSSKSESDNRMDWPSSSSKGNRSKTNPFHGYKELVLTGLGILWRLAGSEDNCTFISSTKHLVSKIMAPVSYDLVHLAGHSAWSTQVVERSLGVILRLIVNTKGDAGADLRQQISSDKGSIATMKNIVICEECKGGELQMKAMQILTQLCIDETADRGNLIKVLVSIFINGDSSNTSIRKTAGETLVALFLSSKSVAILLPKEELNEFVGSLAKILLQVGDNDTCRKNAAEILEHLCIHYAENGEYLGTLKNTITGAMPEVLREICHGSTGEEEKPEYARSDTDVESQSKTKRKKKNKKKSTSSTRGQNQQHKLHVALLSLYVTACEKLHLDLNAISLGQATDPGECVAFSLATKMVQLNRDLITADSLTAMKLTTRMVIAAMKKLEGNGASVDRANLESLIDSLSSVSETMLDLEGCIVFAMTKPATVDTLSSLVKQARQLHAEIKDQDSEIVPAS